MTDELQALRDADFGWVRSLDSVWSDEQVTDAGPNQDGVDRIIAELAALTKAPDPPGRVLLGQAGIGKTHLMGVLRRRAWAEHCWFVMLDVIGITDFWKSAALSFVTSLLQSMRDGQRQYEAVIAGVARRFKIEKEVKAAVATNPLLKGTGPALDPRLLFYGPDAARTRISVINLSGLASEEAKEDFVNRLQMTLFGWVKKHPSPRGMLYVIDEAQTFMPSGGGALSKTSGVQLVAQARKYGLGMIVVTQAPKGIDNKVVSNCTTMFLGKQNSPTDQQSVKGMVAATGGSADDIGKLATGEFYFKTERSGKPVKLRTPICLSYHPPNPPTPEEVVARARQSASRAVGPPQR